MLGNTPCDKKIRELMYHGLGRYASLNSDIQALPRILFPDPTAKNPSFTSPAGADVQGGSLIFMLTVTDSYDQLSSTAKCAVTIKNQ